MRNLLLTFALLLTFGLSFGQVKVFSTSETVIGPSTGITTPDAQLHVVGDTKVDGGHIIVKSTDKNGIIRGEGPQRISILTAADGATSRAFLGFWGDESHTSSPDPTRAGEMVLHCNYFRVGTGKTAGGFAATDFEVKADGDTYAYGDVYATGTFISSDQRLKNNIKDLKLGLDAVLQMNPKQYYYNGKGGTNIGRLHTGVLAQEFAEIAPEGVKSYKYDDDFNKVHEEYLAVDEGMIKFMLVNAVKEQQVQIDAKDAKITDLEDRLARIEAMLAQGANTVTAVEVKDAALGQNAPNPFNERTAINYAVPTKASSAVVEIYNLNGSLLKSVNVAKGNGTLELNAGELAAGTYTYRLVIDGQTVDTKKMVLTK